MATAQSESQRHKAAAEDTFGDPSFVNVELAPVPVGQRILGWQHLGPLWGVLALVPGVYAFVGVHAPPPEGLAALALGLGAAAVVGMLLARTAARYGVGFAAVCRAAFGARGALLPLALRWIVGALFVAFGALALARWVVSLVVVALPNLVLYGESLQWFTWGVGWLLVLFGWWVARGGMSRVALLALLGAGAGVCLSFGLVVFAGIASKGFGSRLGTGGRWGAVEFGTAAVGSLLLVLPAVLAAADWARFRRPRSGHSADRVAGSRLLDRVTPWVMVPVGVGLSFVGLLLSSAAAAVQGHADAAPIPDGAAFGGLGGGALAVALSLCLWMAAVPLVGFYSPALAVCGTWPRRIGFRRGLSVVLLLALGCVPALDLWGEAGPSLVGVSLTVMPVMGVLLVDELVLRRGRVILDELFQASPEYGPTFGATASALLGCGLGWLLHPDLLAFGGRHAPATLSQALGRLSVVPPVLLGAVGGALVAGVAYGLLAPVERRLMVGLGKRWGRRGGRKPEFLGDSSTTHGMTNPHFTYDDKDKG